MLPDESIRGYPHPNLTLCYSTDPMMIKCFVSLDYNLCYISYTYTALTKTLSNEIENCALERFREF